MHLEYGAADAAIKVDQQMSCQSCSHILIANCETCMEMGDSVILE